jgi:Domain of unknown function (DUF1840)
MSVTFKSKATGDLLMVTAHAEQMLQCIGKTAKEPGILQVYQMDAALQTLRNLPHLSVAEEEALAEQADKNADTPADASSVNVPMSDGISLHKRARPFTQMIEAAKAADADIVWGV